MREHEKTLSASDMDSMSPQDRADAVARGIARSWDDVEPDLRQSIEEKARQLAESLHADT